MLNSPEGCDVPKKLSEIQTQLEFCDAQRENLFSAIQLLENRLSPLLRVETSNIKASGEEPGLTTLANDIKKNGNAMRDARNTIQDILDRLEI